MISVLFCQCHVVANLQNGPQWSHLLDSCSCVVPSHTVVGWSVWPVKCSTSGSVSLSRLGCKRHFKARHLHPLWITHSGGNQLSCHAGTREKPAWRGAETLANSYVSEAPWRQIPWSGPQMTAASWETWARASGHATSRFLTLRNCVR